MGFEELKVQLANLPTLQPPIPGESLSLYVASSESAISVLLVLETGEQ